MLTHPEPVLVVDRFPALLSALLDVLHSLTPDEWQRLVHGGDWTVKDLAQHLLGDELNILSGKRDGYREKLAPVDTWDELVGFINQRNAIWVEATRRLSPRVICDLLKETGEQVNAFFQQVDLHAIGNPVSWAGRQPAPVWLDVAREFTERWHHQQHIRDALGRPGAMEPFFLGPVLATFVRALPHTFRAVDAPEGTTATLLVSGPAGGTWSVVREQGRWQLYQGRPEYPQAGVEVTEDTAWRLFTKGIPKEEARRRAILSGDLRLAAVVLDTVSIIA